MEIDTDVIYFHFHFLNFMIRLASFRTIYLSTLCGIKKDLGIIAMQLGSIETEYLAMMSGHFQKLSVVLL